MDKNLGQGNEPTAVVSKVLKSKLTDQTEDKSMFALLKNNHINDGVQLSQKAVILCLNTF